MPAARRLRHAYVASTLAALGDDALATIVRAASGEAVGVGGGSSVIEVHGVPVLAKRIPISARELAHPHGTANLFELPTCCRYGMYRLAAPSVSAWRELAANLIVTEGVLAGEAEGFPLLHHWRVLPGRAPVAAEHQDIEAVVAQFGGHPAVRARLEALAGATASLVLFLEYLPHPVLDRLTDPVGQAEALERQLFEQVGFLRRRELLHLDGHFGNLRADDERIYLVDFGLAISPRFELSDAERAFVARHADHDADHASMRLVNWLVTTVCGVPVPGGGRPVERDAYVRRCARGELPPTVPPVVAAILARHAGAAARMNDFCARLFGGDLDAEYRGALTDLA